jgi:hypothetical protein
MRRNDLARSGTAQHRVLVRTGTMARAPVTSAAASAVVAGETA